MGSVIAFKIPAPVSNDLGINMRGAPFNPLPPIGPDIDWNMVLTVTYDPQTRRHAYSLVGIHDGFPAYQLRLNGEVVWSHDPIDEGQTPLSLIGTGEFAVLDSGLVPL
ncbi:MAG: hypothetical protein AAF351_06935 [Pseudomonadota bacterium]